MPMKSSSLMMVNFQYWQIVKKMEDPARMCYNRKKRNKDYHSHNHYQKKKNRMCHNPNRNLCKVKIHSLSIDLSKSLREILSPNSNLQSQVQCNNLDLTRLRNLSLLNQATSSNGTDTNRIPTFSVRDHKHQTSKANHKKTQQHCLLERFSTQTTRHHNSTVTNSNLPNGFLNLPVSKIPWTKTGLSVTFSLNPLSTTSWLKGKILSHHHRVQTPLTRLVQNSFQICKTKVKTNHQSTCHSALVCFQAITILWT